ncbi:MAG: J domain-containing protein [Sphingomicrobium sp.]
MPPGEDYYAVLRVAPGADRAAVQAAYRALMRRYHPDLNASEEAAANATMINEAYACLRDTAKRAAYDWQRHPRSRPRATASPSSPAPRPRPVWTGPTPRAEASTPWYHPSWGKAIGLGIAALLTGITFTITSAIPPTLPPVAKPALAVSMRVATPPDKGRDEIWVMTHKRRRQGSS